MTGVEVLLLFAIAVLFYQEMAWRDRVRRIEADCERRLAAEVAIAYDHSLAETGEPVRALTFRAEKQEPRGLFHEVTRHLFLAITMQGAAVKYAAGDLNEIDRFAIPPEIKAAILEFLSCSPQGADLCPSAA